ncbi:hypothetical protein PRIPAC_78615 [Pristionchus pacificus]|uniref:Uncharacterized protein n=1 Tax=Pristionchus pacificus TaxID=54126 RepID=A0A2A6BY12_PRIPA|nr:hypothetical protein PRIPAC_78615 [Pristionchus pacificus]|eukprot:PDM70824.1 hypothetical protein PRIPAC_45028 [Pristionchus pacificus]
MRVLFSCLLIAFFAQTVVEGWRSHREEQEEKLMAGARAASSSVNNLAGVFKQVNKAGEPIFKHAIYKPSLFGNAVSGLGNIFWASAVAMEAANVAEAAGKDLNEGKITNTVHASTKAVGSWTGAAYGASTGAALLSFIPGVGTLVGGIAGGMIGAYTGSLAGEIAANVVVGRT